VSDHVVVGLKVASHDLLFTSCCCSSYAVLGVIQFGENDPANFGVVPVAMMTLFQVSTLTSWTQITLTQWYGCDTYLYNAYHPSDDIEMIETSTGALPGWGCHKPSKQPVFAFFFFTSFTIVTVVPAS
jgi:hypothetical protein